MCTAGAFGEVARGGAEEGEVARDYVYFVSLFGLLGEKGDTDL